MAGGAGGEAVPYPEFHDAWTWHRTSSPTGLWQLAVDGASV
jgi:hypothetical protein